MYEEGKIELPDNGQPAADQRGDPLVTFALLAYNQESYVSEAIEGAFSQTYEPLEIILSDDYSTDRTYEIMQGMAATYRGPHKIQLNKNPQNVGCLGHLLRVANLARGAFLICAAGDDVSQPKRVAVLAHHWRMSGAWAVCSSFDIIDSQGLKVAAGVTPRNMSNGFQKYFDNDRAAYSVNGASAGYDKALLRLLKAPKSKILYEDIAASFVINGLRKEVLYVDIPLLEYRKHDNAIVHNNKEHANNAEDAEKESKRISHHMKDVYEYLLELDASLESTIFPQWSCNKKMLQQEYAFLMERLDWNRKTHIQRLKSLLYSKSLNQLKWKISRLLGNFPRYQPKVLLSRLLRQYG